MGKPLGRNHWSSRCTRLSTPFCTEVPGLTAILSLLNAVMVLWGRAAHWWGAMDQPQDGGGTGRHRRALTLPSTTFTAQGQTEVVKCAGQSQRALGRRCQQTRQALSKGTDWTGWVETAEAAYMEDKSHGIADQRQITRCAGVVRVDARGWAIAAWAIRRRGAAGSDHCKMCLVDLQSGNLKAGK